MNYTIQGCNVQFPHNAYGVQLSFMAKTISALENGHNALLEAPTGSGKTLSLLCSAMAWQQREKQRIEEGLAAAKAADGGGPGGGEGGGAPAASASGGEGGGFLPDDDGSGGFIPGEEGAEGAYAPARKKAPKIYYATRTHSQIAQVVKELKRSAYHPRMAVLASKKQYCVNKTAKAAPSVDAACEDLLKDSKCMYFKNVQGLVNSAWAFKVADIEDLLGAGRAARGCPYFASRKWKDEAELIFSPYSYLLDPVIRRAMDIDVRGAMLIFDEAHNIEDVCREAASLDLDRDTLIEAHITLCKAVELNGKPEVYQPLADAAGRLLKWINDTAEGMAARAGAGGWGGGGGRSGGGGRGGFQGGRQEGGERMFQGSAMLAQLEGMGLGPDCVDPLWAAYEEARAEEESMQQSSSPPGKGAAAPQAGAGPSSAPPKEGATRVGAATLGLASRLITILRLLHQVSLDGGRDYRLVLQRAYDRGEARKGDRFRRGRDEGQQALLVPGWTVTFCLWCLNPSVAFKGVAEIAHSIVLTSGTLAPLDGFASELGVPFEVKLEAPHVVDMRRQVWAGVVSTGCEGGLLQATYKHTNDPAFQDALGRVVLESCAAIPDGVLLFLPSYALLDKLSLRWKASGLWAQLAALKPVVAEPRGGGADALTKVMTDYYRGVAEGRGGLFMAVCRGKVSEGLDFADANARGVIIVGIPYPSVMDTKVKEKKAFNDAGRGPLGLLSGEQWYSQQAFRALNQALGRCIRHRGDYGAIMLVDERFRQPRSQLGLSRWVRTALVAHPSFAGALASMRGFFASIAADPPPAVAAALGLAAAGAAAPKAEPGKENAGGAGAAAGKADIPLAPIFLAAKAQARSRAAAASASLPAKAEPGIKAEAEAAVGAPWANAPMGQAHTAAGAAGVAGAPDSKAAVLQQAAQQQQQQQQQQQAVTAAQQAAQQAARQEAAAAAAQRGQLARVLAGLQALLPGWVYNDVAEYAAHLRSRGIGPGGARLESPTAHPVTSVEHLAAAAVMDAFALARECWAGGQPMASLFTSRTVPPPRGLQAVLASFIPPLPQLPPGLVPEAMEWGATHLRGFPLPLMLEALEAQYQAEAAQYLPAGQPTLPPPSAQQQQYPQQQFPQQQQEQGRSGIGSGGQPWQQPYLQQTYPQQQQQQPGRAPEGATRKREPSDAHSKASGSAAKRCVRAEAGEGGLNAVQRAQQAAIAAAISEGDADDSQWVDLGGRWASGS